MAFLTNVAASGKKVLLGAAENLFPKPFEAVDTFNENIEDASKPFKKAREDINKITTEISSLRPALRKISQQVKTGKFGSTREERKGSGSDSDEMDDLDFDFSSFDNDSFDDSSSSDSSSSKKSKRSSSIISKNYLNIIGGRTSKPFTGVTTGDALISERLAFATAINIRQFEDLINVTSSVDKNISLISSFMAEQTVDYYTRSFEHFEGVKEYQREILEGSRLMFEYYEEEKKRKETKLNYNNKGIDTLFDPTRIAKNFENSMGSMFLGMGADFLPMETSQMKADPLGYLAIWGTSNLLNGMFSSQITAINKYINAIPSTIQDTLTRWSKGDNPFLSFLGDFLRIDDTKNSLKINKLTGEKVDFDDKTRNSIINTIPDFLSMIEHNTAIMAEGILKSDIFKSKTSKDAKKSLQAKYDERDLRFYDEGTATYQRIGKHRTELATLKENADLGKGFQGAFQEDGLSSQEIMKKFKDDPNSLSAKELEWAKKQDKKKKLADLAGQTYTIPELNEETELSKLFKELSLDAKDKEYLINNRLQEILKSGELSKVNLNDINTLLPEARRNEYTAKTGNNLDDLIKKFDLSSKTDEEKARILGHWNSFKNSDGTKNYGINRYSDLSDLETRVNQDSNLNAAHRLSENHKFHTKSESLIRGAGFNNPFSDDGGGSGGSGGSGGGGGGSGGSNNTGGSEYNGPGGNGGNNPNDPANSSLGKSLRESIAKIHAVISEIPNKIYKGVSSTLSKLYEGTKNLFKNQIDWIKDTWKVGLGKLSGNSDNLADKTLLGSITDRFKLITDGVKNLFTGEEDSSDKKWSDVFGSWFSTKTQSIRDWLTGTTNTKNDFGSSIKFGFNRLGFKIKKYLLGDKAGSRKDINDTSLFSSVKTFLDESIGKNIKSKLFGDDGKDKSWMENLGGFFTNKVFNPLRDFVLGDKGDKVEHNTLLKAISFRFNDVLTSLKSKLVGDDKDPTSFSILGALSESLNRTFFGKTDKEGNVKTEDTLIGNLKTSFDKNITFNLKKLLLGSEGKTDKEVETIQKTGFIKAIAIKLDESVFKKINTWLFGKEKADQKGIFGNIKDTVGSFINHSLYGENKANKNGLWTNIKDSFKNFTDYVGSSIKKSIIAPSIDYLKNLVGPTVKELLITYKDEAKYYLGLAKNWFTGKFTSSTEGWLTNIFGKELADVFHNSIVKPLKDLTKVLKDSMSKVLGFLFKLPLNFFRGMIDSIKISRMESGRATYSPEETERLMQLKAKKGGAFDFERSYDDIRKINQAGGATNAESSDNSTPGSTAANIANESNKSKSNKSKSKKSKSKKSKATSDNSTPGSTAANIANESEIKNIEVENLNINRSNAEVLKDISTNSNKNDTELVNTNRSIENNTKSILDTIVNAFKGTKSKKRSSNTTNDLNLDDSSTSDNNPTKFRSSGERIAANTDSIASNTKPIATISETLISIYDEIKGIGGGTGGGGGRGGSLPDRIARLLGSAISAPFAILNSMITGAKRVLMSVIEIPSKIISWTFKTAGKVFDAAFKIIPDILGSITTGISKAVNGLLKGVSSILEVGMNLATTMAEGAFKLVDGLASNITKVIGPLLDATGALAKSFLETLDPAVTAIGNAISKLTTGIIHLTEKFLSFGLNLASKVFKLPGRLLGLNEKNITSSKITNFTDLLSISRLNPLYVKVLDGKIATYAYKKSSFTGIDNPDDIMGNLVAGKQGGKNGNNEESTGFISDIASNAAGVAIAGLAGSTVGKTKGLLGKVLAKVGLRNPFVSLGATALNAATTGTTNVVGNTAARAATHSMTAGMSAAAQGKGAEYAASRVAQSTAQGVATQPGLLSRLGTNIGKNMSPKSMGKAFGKGGFMALITALFGDALIDSFMEKDTILSDTLKGVLTGGAAGSVFGPPGLVVGALIGGVLKGGRRLLINMEDTFKGWLDYLTDLPKKIETWVSELPERIEKFTKSIPDMIKNMFGTGEDVEDAMSDGKNVNWSLLGSLGKALFTVGVELVKNAPAIMHSIATLLVDGSIQVFNGVIASVGELTIDLFKWAWDKIKIGAHKLSFGLIGSSEEEIEDEKRRDRHRKIIDKHNEETGILNKDKNILPSDAMAHATLGKKLPNPEKKLAGGGFVDGEGTSKSDSIGANLSKGEYVLNAKAVGVVGKDKLDILNTTTRSMPMGNYTSKNEVLNNASISASENDAKTRDKVLGNLADISGTVDTGLDLGEVATSVHQNKNLLNNAPNRMQGIKNVSFKGAGISLLIGLLGDVLNDAINEEGSTSHTVTGDALQGLALGSTFGPVGALIGALGGAGIGVLHDQYNKATKGLDDSVPMVERLKITGAYIKGHFNKEELEKKYAEEEAKRKDRKNSKELADKKIAEMVKGMLGLKVDPDKIPNPDKKLAGGGFIKGANENSVSANLSKGEYVLNNRAVGVVGTDALDDINSKAKNLTKSQDEINNSGSVISRFKDTFGINKENNEVFHNSLSKIFNYTPMGFLFNNKDTILKFLSKRKNEFLDGKKLDLDPKKNLNYFTSFLEKASNTVLHGTALGSVINYFLDSKNKLMDKAKSMLKGIGDFLSKIGGFIGDTYNSVKTGISETYDSVKATAGKMYDGASSAISSGINTVSEVAGQTYEGAKTGAKEIYEGAKEAGSYAMEKVSTVGGNLIGAAKRFIDGAKWSGQAKGIPELIDQISAKHGLDAGVMKMMAMIESKGNPQALNKGSGASGIYQFIPSTARAYGMTPGGNVFDPETNINAGAKFLKDNIKGMKKAGIPVKPSTVYLAHQQGLGGLKSLWSAITKGTPISPGLRKNMNSNYGQGKSPSEFMQMWDQITGAIYSKTGGAMKAASEAAEKTIESVKTGAGNIAEGMQSGLASAKETASSMGSSIATTASNAMEGASDIAAKGVDAVKGGYNAAVGSINDALFKGTQDAINKGVGYKYGAKNSKTGAIDCSGWVMELNKGIVSQLSDPSIVKSSIDAMNKGAATGGAAGIIQSVGSLTGSELDSNALNMKSMKEGMLIGVDYSQGGAKSGAGRYKGIDHIVQVVKDPSSNTLQISESSSKKGVHLTDASTWLSRMNSKKVPIYGVDPYSAIRGEDGALDMSAGGVNPNISPIQVGANENTNIMEKAQTNTVASMGSRVNENSSIGNTIASAVTGSMNNLNNNTATPNVNIDNKGTISELEKQTQLLAALNDNIVKLNISGNNNVFNTGKQESVNNNLSSNNMFPQSKPNVGIYPGESAVKIASAKTLAS